MEVVPAANKPGDSRRRLTRLNLIMGIALSVILALTAAVYFVQAATVSQRQDVMSNQVLSAAAAHQISFKLSAGNSFDAAEQLTVDFPAQFAVGGTWATADFSFNDGAARTIAAVAVDSPVPCIDGADNIGVAVDTAGAVFRVKACNGYSSRPPGATITFTIGGTAPDGTLSNPAVAGSYTVYLLEAGGDCGDPLSGVCSLAVYIIDSSTVGVSASKTIVCGNGVVETGEQCEPPSVGGCTPTCQFAGGGGGGGGGDTASPVISGVSAISITKNAATIIWTTDEAANSTVQYGLTMGYGSVVSDSGYITDHSRGLISLDEGTLYHYKVCSADPTGNSACSDDATFETTDETLPTIFNELVTVLSPTSALLTWNTDESATSFVDYGIVGGPPYASTDGSGGLVTDHSVTLSGLTADTTYHYRLRSGDAAANERITTDNTFKTLAAADVTKPVISDLVVTALSPTSIGITWKTDEPATSHVDYGFTAGPPYASTQGDAGLVTSHSIILTGLTNGATYHLQARSADAAANEATTADTPITLGDITPPVISGIGVSGITQVGATVSWNTDEPASALLEYGKTVVYGSTRTVAELKTSQSIALSGLDPDTTYYYRITAADALSNSSFATGNFTTLAALPPPGNVTAFTAVGGDQSVLLSWVNPADASLSGVKIVGKTGDYPTGPSDGRLVYDGLATSVTDTGLDADTTYYYVAYAHDIVPAYASGAQISARTAAAGPDVSPPGPVTDLTTIPGDGKVRLTWTNPSDQDWISTRIVRLPGADPASYDNGTLVYDGTGDNTLDAFNIVNGTTYHYAAFAYDARPNYAGPARAQATPQTGLPEPPSVRCADSDGGANYDVAGSVTATDGTYFDTCVSPTVLTEYSCNGDVHASEDHECGSGNRCIGGSCTPEGTQPIRCGDGLCQEPENSSNCLADCPVPPTEPEVPPEGPIYPGYEGTIPESRLRFYATAGRVVLRLGLGNVLTVFPRMTVTAVIPDESLNERPTKDASINFMGSSYEMSPTHSLEADFISQPDVSTEPLQVVLNYVDGTSETYDIKVKTLPYGRVYEVDDQGHEVAIPDARVSLFIDQGGGNFGLWPGGTFNQTNPLVTDSQGKYGYIVAWGSYKLIVEKSGFHTKETMAFPVSGANIITQDLRLIRLPPEIIQNVADILASDASAGDKALALAGAAQEQLTYGATVASENIKEFVQNTYVEQGAERTVTPIATAVAVANVASYGAVTATGIPYAIYLYSLLMHPALLVARRKRRKWGVVFNSLTNLPLDLVIVRLLDAKTGRVVRSSVTDKDGRYLFMVSPGQYKITVAKAGYVFPTVFLKGQAESGALTDLYHGDVLDIKEDTTLTLNIPVDSLTSVDRPRKVFWSGIARRAQKSVGIAAILFMVGAVIITPKPFTIGMLCTNVIVYFMFQRLSVTKRPKSWGIVYDGKTKQPLRNALARIFEAKYNKLLETQVTDSRGHYAFLVGRNVYYVTFEKPGYTHEQKGPVDLLDVKKFKEGVINIDVSLVPAAAPQRPVSGPKPPVPPLPAAPTPSPAALPPSPAASAAPPPPMPPPAAPTPPPAEKKIPWELQFLKKGPQPVPRPQTSTPPPTPPAPAPPPPKVPSSPLPAAPAAPSPKASPPAASPPPAQTATKAPGAAPVTQPPKVPSSPLPAAGMISPKAMIQDVERAHPDIKLVQDAEHAHPGENKTVQNPVKPAGPNGSKTAAPSKPGPVK